MNDDMWARVILATVEGAPEGEAVELVSYLVAQVRTDTVEYTEAEDEEDDEPPPDDAHDDEVSVSVATNGHRGGAKRHLTDEQVNEIRTRYAEGGIHQGELAAEYGVSGSAIGAIVTRRSYADLPLQPGEAGYVDESEAREKRIMMRRAAAADSMEPGQQWMIRQ